MDIYIVLLFGIISVILLISIYDYNNGYDEDDYQGKSKKEEFYGYTYPYIIPYSYYPYLYSGCFESMFGGIVCNSPPYYY